MPLSKKALDMIRENRVACVVLVGFPLGWLAVSLTLSGKAAGEGGLPLFLYSYLCVLACLAALAYSQRQIRGMILVDPLTNVYNKRYFFRALDTEFSRSRRVDAPLALIRCSLVNVQWLADELGKSLELVHRLFCETVASTIRETDVFSRVDANAYTLLLSNTDDAGAQALARRLENMIMREYRKMKPSLPDAVAFGTCCTRLCDCRTPIEVYDKAIRAHSLAVASERNRIMSCTDGVAQSRAEQAVQ
ncbi:GGDEF domain-containing protein [Desulfovibrio psychrotolerans]|uniref:GGDEF domain-containing protein n=1 Tax=Desulfovibrio psychrotolerans TaxID=415242 RepID=A0A7J0BU98_9BACT|nr:diguanylate cyclase [Desulfovibrio psychrotolerans]GFM37289.1 GGDEF domain-containing protein [Desulfovibrio psychrotolerans]